MDMMNYTLERIANQTASYNFTDGRLIATNPSTPPPPFRASTEDIRVNVLWFASLIISLITSSFGMLVKQWMDDFLAVDIPEPQARLRLRHFRAPQIEAWMVYEIVACLPLLLHLSLGLFFVGLCYFTSAIHASVGHTTLPLVIGWTLCLFVSTALPIFFPRCPYKISLFRPTIALLHRTVSHLAGHKRWTSEGMHAQGLEEALSTDDTRSHASRDDFSSRPSSLVIQEDDLLRDRRTHLTKLHSVVSRTLRTYLSRMYTVVISALRDIPDEEKVLRDSAADLEIFASIDAMRANDEILHSIVVEELPLINPSMDQAVSFAIDVLSHRARTVAESERLLLEWPFRNSYPFDLVRTQARESILTILYRHIGPNREDWQVYGWDSMDSNLVSLQGKVALSLNKDQCTVLCALTMIISTIADSDSPTVDLPPHIIAFLRWYLNDRFNGPFICRNILYLMGWHCQDQNSHWTNIARLLVSLTKLATPLRLTTIARIRCFKSIQCLQITTPQDRLVSGFHLTWNYPHGFVPWNDWVIPDGAPTTLKSAVLRYLFNLVLADFRRVERSQEPSQELEALESQTPEMLHCVLRQFLIYDSRGTRKPNRSSTR